LLGWADPASEAGGRQLRAVFHHTQWEPARQEQKHNILWFWVGLGTTFSKEFLNITTIKSTVLSGKPGKKVSKSEIFLAVRAFVGIKCPS
jgi:hypothetical protein